MYRHGQVVELDGARALARVEFRDLDGVTSWWLGVNSALASSGASRVYVMPEIGAQVHCLVDPGGEEGVILGARYSDEDQPPASDPTKIVMDLGGGLQLTYDKGAGSLAISMPAGLTIEVGGAAIRMTPGGIALEGATLTHNGIDISELHRHEDVVPGAGISGPPVD